MCTFDPTLNRSTHVFTYDIDQQTIIITSLPNAKAVETVFLDPSTGLLAGCSPSSKPLFLETSTIEANASLQILQAVQAALPDAQFLDAPVSGGIGPAHNGTLTFMVGGPQSTFDKAKPIMATMGKEQNLIHCGKPGAGLATKQINNYIAYVSFVALSEGQYLLSIIINASRLNTDDDQACSPV